MAQHGIGQAFGVVGGAIMFITDALRRCESIRSTFTHHEQAAAIAAEAYSKITNTPALVFATAGPGTTNIITGVADAYMDSIPMVVLIGDVRSTIAADFTKQRYNAPQEVNQAGLMKPIVKTYLYLTPDMSAEAILSAVDATAQDAVSGRPGPVCISMPLDVQGMNCDSNALERAIPTKPSKSNSNHAQLQTAMHNLVQAKRPLVLLGAGVRISGMSEKIMDIINHYAIPYCVTAGAVDMQDQFNPLSCGCVGPTSQRAANILFQASDYVLALATGFGQSVTGFNIEELVQNKKVILVNVDAAESIRFNHTNIQTIEAHLADFCQAVDCESFVSSDHTEWLQKVNKIKSVLTAQSEAQMRTMVGEGFLSAYDVSAEISRNLTAEAIVVLGISLDAHSVFNSFKVTRGQRVLVSRNLGPMGWDVPGLLGAALTSKHSESLVLITGDGSLMLNIQELAVIAGMRIPACIFVFNNDGYVSIRTTQSNFFGQQFFGCNTATGLHVPPLEPLAKGFGFAYNKLSNLSDISQILAEHKKSGVPRMVECLINPDQLREPRLVTRVKDGKFKTPALHDMTPALPVDLADLVRHIFPQLLG